MLFKEEAAHYGLNSMVKQGEIDTKYYKYHSLITIYYTDNTIETRYPTPEEREGVMPKSLDENKKMKSWRRWSDQWRKNNRTEDNYRKCEHADYLKENDITWVTGITLDESGTFVQTKGCKGLVLSYDGCYTYNDAKRETDRNYCPVSCDICDDQIRSKDVKLNFRYDSVILETVKKNGKDVNDYLSTTEKLKCHDTTPQDGMTCTDASLEELTFSAWVDEDDDGPIFFNKNLGQWEAIVKLHNYHGVTVFDGDINMKIRVFHMFYPDYDTKKIYYVEGYKPSHLMSTFVDMNQPQQGTENQPNLEVEFPRKKLITYTLNASQTKQYLEALGEGFMKAVGECDQQ